VIEIGTILEERYRIDRLLSHGGMGAVYLAWDLRLGVACAVKVNMAHHTAGEFADKARDQFEHEATILAALRHPNLPRVTNYFVLGEDQYLVMDYVAGDDLAQRLKQHGPYTEVEVLPWANQICDALTYLHCRPEAPVIHRDIKPANLKITPEGRLLLVDFGLSKLYAPNVGTKTGAKGFTRGFSPPEQYDLGHTDARSDEYALAATLYNLLSGHVPPDALQLKLGLAGLRPLAEYAPGVSTSVASAIMRALSLDQADRFETVADFQRHLLAALPATRPFGGALLRSTSQREYRLVPGRNLVGRLDRATGQTPQVNLADEPDGDTVSRRHAWLTLADGLWYLEPHGGHKNVIRLNGAPLTAERMPLRSGDEIQCGAVRLIFQVEDTLPAAS